MYTRCLFCTHALGANEEIEAFPVGARLAFDVDKGRLWAVCPRCARWNLTPLEERWEAVEACERRFRATPLRASTDNVGLARLPSGLELIRVGRAVAGPELALWRYGRRFRWRRRAALVRAGARDTIGAVVGAVPQGAAVLTATSGTVVATVGSPVLATAVATIGAGVVVGLVGDVVRSAIARRTVARVRDGDGAPLVVRARDLEHAALRPSDDAQGWALRLVHRDGTQRLTGAAAVRAAGILLARLDRRGAEEHEIRIAARRLAALPDPLAAFRLTMDGRSADMTPERAGRWRWLASQGEEAADAADAGAPPGALARVSPDIRLALEMAANEEPERRAMAGELAALEAAWREAEEIAAIADDLLLPAGVETWLQRRRATAGGHEG